MGKKYEDKPTKKSVYMVNKHINQEGLQRNTIRCHYIPTRMAKTNKKHLKTNKHKTWHCQLLTSTNK